MQFMLFEIDFFLKEHLFGIGFLTFKWSEDMIRSLFTVYWNDGELIIDFLWIRVYSGYYFWFLFNKE